MAKRKIEQIRNLGKDVDNLTVQKSRPLFALWRSDITLAEFKILDTYLSRINSRHPENRVVIFEKSELERLLDVKKINTEDLKERLKNLMGNVVEVPDTSEKKGFRLVTLFEEAIAEKDDSGQWMVKLECSQKAMKYFFNIENLGYLRYKLRCITALKSRYTYIMFTYLEANRFRKIWEVDLAELKEILACDNEEYAKEFKYFNRDVLKKVHKEIIEKTECRYSYEPIKKGRVVVAIRFVLETLSTDIIDENEINQISFEDYSNEDVDSYDDSKELWEDAINEFLFNQEQIDELREVLDIIPYEKMPQSPACQDAPDLQKYHYMQIKAKEINRRNKEKRIQNKFSYLLKILKNDAAQG